VSMMGWVGSGEDFCGLGWVQKFWIGLSWFWKSAPWPTLPERRDEMGPIFPAHHHMYPVTIKFVAATRVERSMFVRSQTHPVPKVWAQRVPIYALTLWRRTTSLGVSGKWRVLRDQPRHCKLHKCVARFVSDRWASCNDNMPSKWCVRKVRYDH